jgi:hypothetical protein
MVARVRGQQQKRGKRAKRPEVRVHDVNGWSPPVRLTQCTRCPMPISYAIATCSASWATLHFPSALVAPHCSSGTAWRRWM